MTLYGVSYVACLDSQVSVHRPAYMNKSSDLTRPIYISIYDEDAGALYSFQVGSDRSHRCMAQVP